jgi:regulator of sigma E protease
MFNLGTNILALVFVLGVMIFVHEFGHFATAKFFRIRVEVFAFGFGPRLFGFRRGHTDYRVCALPLGGYVKMKGENPDEVLEGAPDEYLSRPKWQRLLVLVMGPAMNVVLAFVLFTVVFLGGVTVESWTEDPVVIGWIESGSPASAADLRPGDRILAVDGEPMATWQDFQVRVLISGGQEMQLEVAGDTGRRTVAVTPEAVGPSDQGYLGALPPFPPIAARLTEGGAGEEAGIQPNDRFVRVDGQEIIDFSQVQEIIRDRPEMPTDVVVERDGSLVELTVTPARLPEEQGGLGYLGIWRPIETTRHRYSFAGAVERALSEMRRQVLLVGEILGRIFTGRMSVKTLSGPIEIARYSGGAARTGDPRVLLSFMAIVSLQLGLLNLLPIPVLDGGHIAIILFEGLIRRDLSMKVKERMLQVGMILLMTLMLVVITFDVIKSLPASWSSVWPF